MAAVRFASAECLRVPRASALSEARLGGAPAVRSQQTQQHAVALRPDELEFRAQRDDVKPLDSGFRRLP